MGDTDLSGRVALVTGASRGIGRGIALELGEHGATVYLTGRTTAIDHHGDSPRRTDTIDDTAEEVTKLGGTAVAVRCDHRVDDDVQGVISRIAKEQGRLDILVNNASGNAESDTKGKRFWEVPLQAWDDLVDVGLRSNFVASALAAPMLIAHQSGLIVNVSSPGSVHYLVSVIYGAAKAGTDKLTADTALELREHHVAVVSIWPGVVKSERMLQRAIRSDDGKSRVQGLDMAEMETARFSGRAVVALATDPNVMSRSGGAFSVADMAREYGFTDVEGNQPASVSDLPVLMAQDDVPEFWRALIPFPSNP
jgi:NAD(P)-dependent dehydrogenase (short-subunit alcohol dehydrogenase family)